MFEAGNPNRRGRISTVDLLALTSLDKLFFMLKILFNFVTKQATLMRRSTVLSLPHQLVFPVWGYSEVSTCWVKHLHKRCSLLHRNIFLIESTTSCSSNVEPNGLRHWPVWDRFRMGRLIKNKLFSHTHVLTP